MSDLRELLDARRWTRDQAEGLLLLLRERPTIVPISGSPGVWTDQPAAATPLFGGSPGARAALLDLSGYTEARITVPVTVAGATGATLRLYGARSAPGSAGSYAPIGAVSAPISSAGVSDSGWLSIPAASRVAIYCDIWGLGGNAVADPALGNVLLWLR